MSASNRETKRKHIKTENETSMIENMNIDRVTVNQYERAFRVLQDDPKWDRAFDMLRVGLVTPEYSRLDQASAVGFKEGRATNLVFGRFAHAVADLLGFVQSPKYFGRPYWTLVLEYEPATRDLSGHTTYVLRAAVVRALKKLKGTSEPKSFTREVCLRSGAFRIVPKDESFSQAKPLTALRKKYTNSTLETH